MPEKYKPLQGTGTVVGNECDEDVKSVPIWLYFSAATTLFSVIPLISIGVILHNLDSWGPVGLAVCGVPSAGTYIFHSVWACYGYYILCTVDGECWGQNSELYWLFMGFLTCLTMSFCMIMYLIIDRL